MRTVSDGLTDGLVWLYQTTGAVGLGIFGLFYSPIVITGLHQSFPAIETTLLADVARTGGSFIFPVASMANIAQGAATLAIFFLTKNEKQKSLASSASVSALLGITEPAIFGINLKMKFPFICAMIASGIASVVLGIFHVLSVAMGPASVIGFISIAPKSIPFFMIGVVISFVLGFALTFVYGKKKMAIPATEAADGEAAVAINENPDHAAVLQDEVLATAVAGKVVPLKDVNDPVFSTEMMGKGIAVSPEDNQVFAPADGVLTVMYDSKHAYGIQSDHGAEILIHIGIDTVNLAGKFFTTNKKRGERVKKGELLGTFDREAIKEAGYDDTVMLLVTNTAAYGEVADLDKTQVSAGDDLVAVSVAYE